MILKKSKKTDEDVKAGLLGSIQVTNRVYDIALDEVNRPQVLSTVWRSNKDSEKDYWTVVQTFLKTKDFKETVALSKSSIYFKIISTSSSRNTLI